MAALLPYFAAKICCQAPKHRDRQGITFSQIDPNAAAIMDDLPLRGMGREKRSQTSMMDFGHMLVRRVSTFCDTSTEKSGKFSEYVGSVDEESFNLANFLVALSEVDLFLSTHTSEVWMIYLLFRGWSKRRLKPSSNRIFGVAHGD
jgi:hypothetical protein